MAGTALRGRLTWQIAELVEAGRACTATRGAGIVLRCPHCNNVLAKSV